MTIAGSRSTRLFALLFALLAWGVGSGSAVAQVRAAFLYSLSSLSGPLQHDFSRVYVDEERDEIFVVAENLVRIYGSSGMELFSFGDDLALGQLLDVAVDENGDIIVLSFKDSKTTLTRCNFRGVPTGAVEITNLPAGVAFVANRMVHRKGLFYFVTPSASTVLITDATGRFLKKIEFSPLLDADARQKEGAEMFGFAVDADANIFFTIPVLFRVYKYSADGQLTFFGRSGSAPGRFGVVAGVAVNGRGDIFVTDRLKSTVMVFDKDFAFLTEFGYRGSRPENLVVPDQIAVDRKDRVYVSQARRRGVSVFSVTRQ